MKNDKPEWLIPKSKAKTNEDVWLYDLEIKMLLIEVKGGEQKKMSTDLNRTPKCIKNHIVRIKDQTGYCNPQGRVGWAFLSGVIIIEDECFVVAPQYRKKDNDTL